MSDSAMDCGLPPARRCGSCGEELTIGGACPNESCPSNDYEIDEPGYDDEECEECGELLEDCICEDDESDESNDDEEATD